MTNDHRMSALSMSIDQQTRAPDSKINVGGLSIRKSNGKGAYGAEVGGLLYQNGGTYSWDMNDPRTGIELHDNIYQCMAADIYAPGQKLGVRRDQGRMYEDDVRSGVQTLARWLDNQFGYQLYRCTSSDQKKSHVVVITVDPEFVVDPETGTTAKEMQLDRNIRALRGQTRSTLKQLIRENGDDARESLKERVACLIDECPVETPIRQLALSVDAA